MSSQEDFYEKVGHISNNGHAQNLVLILESKIHSRPINLETLRVHA